MSTERGVDRVMGCGIVCVRRMFFCGLEEKKEASEKDVGGKTKGLFWS